MNKILVSPSSFGEISNEPISLLTGAGYEVVKNPYGRKLTEQEVVELAYDCLGIVAGVEPLTASVIAKLPNLSCISRVGVGMDSVDVEFAASKKITVVNTPNGPTRAVAELALGLTFSLLRSIPQANEAIHNGNWKKYTGNLLHKKWIGIIGLGRIGKMVAENFRSLGNPVIGFDPHPDENWALRHDVKLDSLTNVLVTADIVTLHVPGRGGQAPLIGRNELSLLKNSAFLINLSRGGVVDEEELYQVLVDKKIKGAAIDVFKEEPYCGNLMGLENVILTPHMGSYAEEGKLQMEIDAVKNLISALK